MEILKTSLIVVQILLSLLIIVLVCMQKSSKGGLGSGMDGSSSDTFFNKSGGRSTVESILNRWTAISAALFIVCSIALTFVLK